MEEPVAAEILEVEEEQEDSLKVLVIRMESQPETAERLFECQPEPPAAAEEPARGRCGPVVEPLDGAHDGDIPATASHPGRQERSNSCSQAELGAHAASVVASGTSDAACAVHIDHEQQQQQQPQQTTITSASQENLAKSASSSQLPGLGSSASASNLADQLSCLELASELANEKSLNSANQEKQSGSSRFFSSKLNTGSLWSLLSVGSNSSYTTTDQHPVNQKQQQQDSMEQASGNNGGQERSLTSSFFNRVNSFKRNSSLLQADSPTSCQPNQSNRNEKPSETNHNSASQNPIKRFRFNNIKYVGSTILHRNFTLPMLEWIAKDIKRQSVRHAQTTGQRQLNLPSREIVLEIQANFLTALSCRDGHPIFKHPMHCISKYAQLQHDQTSFSYLIRDTKDAPYCCHVFQAKSASKVHDIFNAIREAAADKTVAPSINLLKKSLSTEAYMRLNSTGIKLDARQQSLDGIQAANLQQAEQQREPTLQFEDSYQFEVMFVKKVKLQCRRVPVSFVDDALETLKSFEVLKGGAKESKASQIKGGVGKRIINASVDERQEYDEACQSPIPSQQQQQPVASSARPFSPLREQPKLDSTKSSSSDSSSTTSGDRRGSSASLNKSTNLDRKRDVSPAASRSCQQSPTKVASGVDCDHSTAVEEANSSQQQDEQRSSSPTNFKKHQSMDCLKSIADLTIKTAKAGNAPNYANDFSPYNTISSNDLNERIAAIPVVSKSSVSLDHETRQRLARQVRETIMATAANIKKDVFASGDKLDSSTSSKALDSLSCTAASSIGVNNPDDLMLDSSALVSDRPPADEMTSATNSATLQQQHSAGNNFDLFRRASARQVVKNRTMLLLIGKDELCTISIDKHQMLFSKSFNSIALCLQGNNNKDHFGLICRDSGKINPQTESYAGFIFKCQSDKVAREIMAALKQVIYNSHHNHYHGTSSPYNPLNSKYKNLGPSIGSQPGVSPIKALATGEPISAAIKQTSLAVKRGFLNSIDLDDAARSSAILDSSLSTTPPSSTSYLQPALQSTTSSPVIAQQQIPKNVIKSMFCDNCPLYWYHRLCCDIESLPAEVSKTVILRRIDNSLPEREQDELYSKFSEFKIESVDEHNTIFMSLLRHLSERKQLKHNQSSSHQAALAKNNPSQVPSTPVSAAATPTLAMGLIKSGGAHNNTLHQRSGSGTTSGSLAFMINQSSDASSAAIDNLKRAKNSISISIENILKRRSSLRDPEETHTPEVANSPKHQLVRGGSFRSRTNNAQQEEDEGEESAGANSLKRSQSTIDYSSEKSSTSGSSLAGTFALGSSIRDSLSRTINYQRDPSEPIPFAGLFRPRGSSFGSRGQPSEQPESSGAARASTECLGPAGGGDPSPCGSGRGPGSPNLSANRFMFPTGVSPSTSSSSILSSVFWKKSIFDKVRKSTGSEAEQPCVQEEVTSVQRSVAQDISSVSEVPAARTRRTGEELRALWRKAILEQITLIKMEKQNLKLQANAQESDIQRLKLSYRDVPYRRDVVGSWDRLLKQNPGEKVPFTDVARLVRAGVPKHRRGSVWMFLMNQYQLRHGTSFQPADSEYRGDANQTYRGLLSQLSLQQHEIFVDIGRTFPSHPYYSQYLSIGQLSLFNLLKAYSLLDQQVGYCQGLSFVAGLLLLHVDTEDEAFELMRHLLFNFGIRKQYLPSMNALHLQLYQLTRLLRDHEFELFNHFDHFDISPSLYAAPWFLTLFASQFPLGFVSRLLDLVFLMGIEAIFRVSLNLLANHRQAILSCASLEATMDYMRSELVRLPDDKSLVNLFDKAMSLDLRNKLIEYEIEYTFYCAEERARSSAAPKRVPRLKANREEDKIVKNAAADKPEQEETPGRQGSEDRDCQRPSEATNTSTVADATATVIIQHLLANNHLKSLRSNYSY